MLCPQSAGLLSNAVTCRESQIYHVKRKKTETKEYIAYDSINERPELTPGRRHQKVVSCGLREGNEFTGGGGGQAGEHEATFWVMEMCCILIWIAVT